MTDQSKTEIADTQSTVEQVKNLLIEQFNASYQSFCMSINRIPFPSAIRNNIVQFLDTGYLWAMEGFKHVNFNPTLPPMPQTQQDASNDKLVTEGTDAA